MKAYGIFAGGGVKGAALAGALEASKRKNIEFLGYGGASAGAIIAYLAALGYDGNEIYLKMIRQPFKKMLFEDEGERFFLLKKSISDISKFPVEFKKVFKCTKLETLPSELQSSAACFVPFLMSFRPIINVLRSKELGVYNTDHLRKTLIDWTVDKRPELEFNEHGELSFESLYNATKIDLKIICSDLSSKRAKVYSAWGTPQDDVLSAVCSSASYPFLFDPNTNNNQVLIDGGLSSNLPLFMFKDEHKHRNVPIYAFDLHKETTIPTEKLGRFSYIQRLIDTALEASDNVMFEMLNAKRVKVNVPKDIDTLDVNISKLDVMRLYYAGLLDGIDFFSNDRTVQLLQASLDNLAKEALANYGPAEMFRVVLNAIQEESTFDEELVRVWLYVPTSRNSIISVSASKNAGATKYEWPLEAADNLVIDARKAWEIKAEIVSTLNDQQKTRVSFPIFREEDTLQFRKATTSESQCIGVLVIDSDLAPEDCMWLYLHKSRVILNEIFRKEMLEPWLIVLSRMLSKPYF